MDPYDEALPIVSLIPETPDAPVKILDQHAALRMAIAERGYVKNLAVEPWDLPGVYILLDPPQTDGTWGAYVGKAPAGIRSRLMSHLRSKDHWRRALLIQRDTTHGFNSAQVAWLEGRLYDLLNASQNAVLSNGNRPSDETLPVYERTMLEQCILPIERVLRLIGYDCSAADDTTVTSGVGPSRKQRFYGVSLSDLMTAGLITAGQRLVSVRATCLGREATVTSDGRVEVEGVVYKTPSAAGAACRNGEPTNGWEFWAAETPEGLVRLKILRSRLEPNVPR